MDDGVRTDFPVFEISTATVKDRVSRATVSGGFDPAKDRSRELPVAETLWVLSPPPFLS
jgi:hypothetical protein